MGAGAAGSLGQLQTGLCNLLLHSNSLIQEKSWKHRQLPPKMALGACLSQQIQPIGYAAKALTKAEQNYPQIK